MSQGREAWLKASQENIDWAFRTLAVYTIPLLFVSSVAMALQVGGLIDPAQTIGGAVTWAAGFILSVSIEMSMLGSFGLASEEIEAGNTGRGGLIRFMGVVFIILTVVTITFAKVKVDAQWDEYLTIVRISAGILYSVIAHKHVPGIAQTAQASAQPPQIQIAQLTPEQFAQILKSEDFQKSIHTLVENAMKGAQVQLERRLETIQSELITIAQPSQIAQSTPDTIVEEMPALEEIAQSQNAQIAQSAESIAQNSEILRNVQNAQISEQGLRIIEYVNAQIAQGHTPTINEIMQETGYAKNTVVKYRRMTASPLQG